MGYFAAVSPDVDAISVECYIHDEDDLPVDEDEEDRMSDWISDLIGGRDGTSEPSDGDEWSDNTGLGAQNP